MPKNTAPELAAARRPAPRVAARAPLWALLAAGSVAIGSASLAFAQSSGPADGAKSADCVAPPAPAATEPPAGPSSGTAPGGAGSTAWTGGVGGSFIGATPGNPTPSSKTEHPATASGLDPTKSTGGETTGQPGQGC